MPMKSLAEIECELCRVVAKSFGRDRVEVSDRFIEDLGVDSLDLIEMFLDVENHFDVTLPNDAPNAVYKAVFTRPQLRVNDLAEIVYLQQGTGKPQRSGWLQRRVERNNTSTEPFTQLGSVWRPDGLPLLERIPTGFRRRTDGMRCILMP